MQQEIEQEKFGLFYGSHLDAERLDWLMFSRLARELTAGERELYAAKWHDYRFMHPTMATYLFAHHYVEVFQQQFSRHVQKTEWGQKPLRHATKKIESGRAYKPVRDFFECRQDVISGLWRARQTADTIGCPYEFYIFEVMEAGMRYQRDYLPRPTQLFQKNAVEAVVKRWHEVTASRLYVATDPRFRLEAFKRDTKQLDHIRWCLAQAGRRANPHHVLADLVFRHPIVPEAAAVKKFGEETVERARRLACAA